MKKVESQALRLLSPILEKMRASLIFLLYRCSLCFRYKAYLASGALYNACFFRS